MLAIPRCQFGEHFFGFSLVADEIVIDQKNVTLKAQPFDLRQLGADLRRGFRPRHAAVNLDDVAELTLERTAARELQRHRGVVIHVG